MDADLFRVTVLAKHKLKLSLRVESIDSYSGAPAANESFALMMLREKSDTGDLAKAMSRDDMVDVVWQEDWAHGFVCDVAANDVVPGDKPKATLDVTVTHAAWIAHVAKGDTWTSRARVIVSECDACEPIAPAISEDTLLTGTIVDVATIDAAPEPIDDGFLYLPRLAWGSAMTYGPELLEIPAYAATAYGVVDRIAKPRTIPADWIGRAVRVEAWSQPEDGAYLGTDGGVARWATMNAAAYGVGEGKLDGIGRLALKAGRRGTKLTYGKALARVRAERVEMAIAGQVHLSVRFRVPPGPFGIQFADFGEVLDYLAGGLADDSTAPLRRALSSDVLAENYIMKVAIDAPPAHDLDALPLELAKAMLTGPWPVTTVRITVKDSRWLAHLTESPPPATLRTVELMATAASR